MSSDILRVELYDPTRHAVRKLKDGRREFIVTTAEDTLLRDGLMGTQDSPVRRGKWHDLLERIHKNVFEGNTKYMSEVLDEIYPSGDYRRDKLYENIPTLRQKQKGLSPSDKRKVKRVLARFTPMEQEYAREDLNQAMFAPPIREELGEKESEDIAKGRIKRPEPRIAEPEDEI